MNRQTWLSTGLLAAVVLLGGCRSTSPGTTKITYYGYYLDDWWERLSAEKVDEVAGYTNVAIVMGVGPVRENVRLLRGRGMKVILELTGIFNDQSKSAWAGELDRLANDLQGMMDSVLALYVMDEPYCNKWDLARLTRATDMVKAKFPNVPTMAVFLNDNVGYGVPASMDWVGVDVYPFNDPPRSVQDSRGAYDRKMGKTLRAARRAAGGKPMILVGQAFGDIEGAFHFSKPEWQRWFFDTAREDESIMGLIWFAYERPGMRTSRGSALIGEHRRIGAEIGLGSP